MATALGILEDCTYWTSVLYLVLQSLIALVSQGDQQGLPEIEAIQPGLCLPVDTFSSLPICVPGITVRFMDIFIEKLIPSNFMRWILHFVVIERVCRWLGHLEACAIMRSVEPIIISIRATMPYINMHGPNLLQTYKHYLQSIVILMMAFGAAALETLSFLLALVVVMLTALLDPAGA
ncbi:hypothetical protein JCM10908_003219 [Rhodotorula pacifica]|uniref:uncharacterized protein n=1 Tax=Rhodotorula pacifica TaxID=1495444 RepID=UPI0031733F11